MSIYSSQLSTVIAKASLICIPEQEVRGLFNECLIHFRNEIPKATEHTQQYFAEFSTWNKLFRKGDPSPAQNPMYVDYEDALNSITLLQREFASQEKDIDKLQGTVRVSEAVNKAKDAEIAAKDQEISFLRMKLDLSNTITETVSGLRPAEYKIKPERDVALTVMVLLQRQLKEAEKKCAEYEKIIKGLEAKNSNLTNDVKQKGEARKAADNKAGMEKAKMNDMLGQLRHEKNDLMREITHLKQELALKRISDDDNLYDAVSPKRVKRE